LEPNGTSIVSNSATKTNDADEDRHCQPTHSTSDEDAMLSSLSVFLSAQDYVPHGMCLLWQPGLIWLHILSDSTIAIAYFTIPFALVYFVSRRHDLAFRGIFVLSGAFILACGTTHVMGVLTLWYPAYWLDGTIKLLTAVISIGTSFVMWRAMPLALALPSAERLERANHRLESALQALQFETAERLRAEEMLRHSEKMKALGQLTGGIAHDFNNLLGVIIGSAEILTDVVKAQPEHADLARAVLNSALSGSLLTRRLLAVARNQPLRPERVDLHALLRDHVEMLRRTLGEAIHIEAKCAADLWFTSADLSQIGDALLNLALNARDAMPQGGNLTIEAANVHLDARGAGAFTEVAEGDYVVLTVTDSGTGMAQDVVQRAVEPFFTTKPPSVGTGLGLSMTYGFAKQSGGHLDITSVVGAGTVVRLYLPRASETSLAVVTPPRAATSDPRGTEAILLVDDNQTLVTVTCRQLRALGYKVVSAPSGPAALIILESDATVDLLFSDIVMSEDMSGYMLAEAARRLRPGLKVLFTTGYTAERSEHDEQHMLYKPYDRRELARAVRTVLDGPAANAQDTDPTADRG
jgi:signal transduction histidine kinase/ActR/RegA family two-component response regulator